MTIATKATRGAVGTNNWTNPSNATADDGANYATCAPAKNNSVTGDWDFAAFSDAEIPVGATINSVVIRCNYKVSTTASIASLGVQAGNNGSFDAEETHTTEPTADTDFDVTFNTTPSETDLKTAGRLVARVRGIRGNDNDAVTISLDYVELRVDYTSSQQFNQSVNASGAGAVSAARQAGKIVGPAGAGATTVAANPVWARTVAAAGAGAVALARSAEKTIAGAGAGAVGLARDVAKIVAASGAGPVAAIKEANKIVAASGTSATTVTALKVFLLTIAVAAAGAVALGKSAGKVVAAAPAGAASIVKAVAATLGLGGASAASLQKQAGKQIPAADASSVSSVRAVEKLVAAPGNGIVALARSIGKGIAAAATGAVGVVADFVAGGAPTVFNVTINVVSSAAALIWRLPSWITFRNSHAPGGAATHAPGAVPTHAPGGQQEHEP